MTAPRNPSPTVDVVVETERGVVLVERGKEPLGWALPGGFVDYGESFEDAARREVREETALEVELTDLLGVYSDPARDPRQHNVSAVYVGRARGTPVGGDDAAAAAVFSPERLPETLCFDHARILADYRRFKAAGERPKPTPPEAPALTGTDRERLLAVARDALEAAITGRPPRPVPGEDGGPLAREGACFVTLYTRGGDLRGCIGSLEARRPLVREVREMAAAAALKDHRFRPVAVAELPWLRISLSVLSPMRPVHEPMRELQIGTHGLLVERGPVRGVLLPQVPVDHGWDLGGFLAHTCIKAGLPPDAWRDPRTEIRAFTAIVFGESRGRE